MLSINQIVNSTSPLPQQSLAMLQLLSKQSGELNALELEHLTAKLRLDIAQFEKKAALKKRHQEEIMQLAEAEANEPPSMNNQQHVELQGPQPVAQAGQENQQNPLGIQFNYGFITLVPVTGIYWPQCHYHYYFNQN